MCGERCSVTPFDSVADVNCDAGVSVVIIEISSHPRYEFTSEHVKVEQTLAGSLIQTATRQSGGVGIKVFNVGECAWMLTTKSCHDQCSITRNILVSQRHRSRRNLYFYLHLFLHLNRLYNRDFSLYHLLHFNRLHNRDFSLYYLLYLDCLNDNVLNFNCSLYYDGLHDGFGAAG